MHDAEYFESYILITRFENTAGVSKHIYFYIPLENTLLKTRGKYDFNIIRVNVCTVGILYLRKNIYNAETPLRTKPDDVKNVKTWLIAIPLCSPHTSII